MTLTISVVTAFFNRADTVAQALASVRVQSWAPVENIVIDGASTDGSLGILRFLGRGGVRPAYVPQVLVRMRLGGISNRSLRSMVLKSREDYAAMRLNGLGGLNALLRKNFMKLPQFLSRVPAPG